MGGTNARRAASPSRDLFGGHFEKSHGNRYYRIVMQFLQIKVAYQCHYYSPNQNLGPEPSVLMPRPFRPNGSR
jgi:hypothetical protein